MAYLALLWKARTIEKYRLKYEKEKINSINADKAELQSTLYQKWTVYQNDSQKKLGKFFRHCCPKGSNRANFCNFMRENKSFVLKVAIGMVGGISTCFLYKIVVYQESLWTALSWAVSVAIILGVAFSYSVRCLVLLLVPGLFSRVGRYTLACYALVLILTGPAANTLKNLDTLSASLACGQGQIKVSVKEMKESKDSPLNLVKETMSATVEEIEGLATKMKELMMVIHRLTMSIAHVLQSSLSWLNSVETICNSKLGSPYDHCAKLLAEGVEDCQTMFPESYQWDWGLIVRSVCFTQRPEALCVLGDFAKGSIVRTVKKKLQTYSSRIQSLFNMGVHIRRSHTTCSNGSLPVNQAAAGIVTDLRNRADTILAWLSWTFALTGMFLMLIVFRAKYYLHMFRTRSRFDNRYVTKELRELDLKRHRQGRETVLPLNTRERAKYVSTASFRLLPSEKMYLTRSIVFMVITTLKLMIHMVADYSLYWVLMSVRSWGCDHTHFQRMSAQNRTRILVSGSGPLAGTLHMLAKALSAPLAPPTTTNCLPNPNPPDLRRYAQIGTLILLLWMLALFEPYGLRLRHVISAHYEPERAKARAVWLYYHIIRTRSCFLKFARRKLHRQYKYTSEEKLTFKRWLHDCIPCIWLRILLGVGPTEPHCLLCYTKHRQTDLERHLKRCETPSCPGVYCARCFMDIGQLCTICYSPEDYGDLSDVSLEKFNSDDSEGEDSNDDDNKPLIMGKRDKEFEQGGTCSNNNKRNKRGPLATRPKDGNEESMPLLDCDYLKEDYTQQGTMHLKYNYIQKQNVATQAIVTRSKVNNDFNNENMSSNIQNPSEKVSIFGMVFMDTEVTVNGITFPKGKLGAIVRTMLLLTSRDDKYSKFRNGATKQKPFVYLVMEMFQPSGIFRKIIPATRNRPLVTIQELSDSDKSEIELKIIEPISSREHPTDFNFNNTESIMKCVQNKHKKKDKISKRFEKWQYSKRNAKRFIDLKKTITTTVTQRISNSRIYCNNYKSIFIRRRRSNQSFEYLKFISAVSKVFSNKFIKYVGFHSLRECTSIGLNVEENKPPITMKKTEKRRNATQHITIRHIDQDSQAKQKSECNLNNMQNSGNTATGATLSIQPASKSSDEGPSKATNENNDIETDNNPDHKAMEVQSHLKEPKKFGFWESLRLRRRKNHSPHLFYRTAKEDSAIILANHKTRKKPPINEKINNDNIDASNVNTMAHTHNDVQSYRVNFVVNDVELGNNNNIMNMQNNKMPLGPGRKETEKPIKKKEVKDNKQEMCSRRINGSKAKKNKIKPRSESYRTDKKKDYEFPLPSEFVILYDETTSQPSKKLIDLNKKLKRVISQMAGSLSKKSKGCRTVSISDIESKKSKENINEDKSWKYVVDSIDHFRKNLPHNGSKSSTEEVVSEGSVETLQGNINQQEEHTETTESCTETESAYESNSNTHSCIHEWTVKPKIDEKNVTKNSKKNTDSIEKKGSAKNREHCACCKCKGKKSEGKSNTKASSNECSSESLINKKGNPKDNGSSDKCLAKHKKKSTRKVDSTDSNQQSSESSKVTKHGKACTKRKESCCKCLDRKCIKESETEGSSDENAERLKRSALDSLQYMKNRIVYKALKNDRSSDTSLQALGKSKKTKKRNLSKDMKEDIEERLLWASDICNQAVLEYANERTLKPKHRNLISTVNRSTTTLTKTADISTCTSDWWSPLLERKAAQKDMGIITVEKNMQEDAILSASHYLMQSDQYCKQMYSMETSPSHSIYQRKKYVTEKPSFKIYHRQKGKKIKKIIECHSYLKQMQDMDSSISLTPKWRPIVAEEHAHALRNYTRRYPKSKTSSWKSRKIKYKTLNYEDLLTNSFMWTTSTFSSSQ